MIDHFGLVQQLTTEPPRLDRRLNDFAFELGWKPSDRLELPATRDFATAHLVVEHGLDYTAVITFLQSPNRFVDLGPSQQRMLASASYNNLIDWHINIDYEYVTFLYNRYRPPEFHIVQELLSKDNISVLQSARFRSVTSKHPVPDVRSLDKALIDTISLWKRQLGASILGISNGSLSALFNAILFVRAAEDHKLTAEALAPASRLLPRIASDSGGARGLTVRDVIAATLENLAVRNIPSGLVELDALTTFDTLDAGLVVELFEDFYRNRFTPYYEYDFSLISKHALSRIYEHYVSILRVPNTEQLSFLPSLAEETFEWKLGNIYTPEFIARFFARYLRARLPLRTFQRLQTLDPSCGSGIFLRCLLELQNEALFDLRTTESIRGTFENATGIDVDPNACHAARLSLSLLSLVLAGEFPANLKIINKEALHHYLENPNFREVADVVVANPPYIKFEAQPPEIQHRVLAVLGQSGTGKPDLYLAMLKIGLDLLKPGGYGLFVLPEAFLKSDAGRGIRQVISRGAFVECVVDLTAVRVFENVGVYTILLIFQKKCAAVGPAPLAKIVRCQGRVGQALQDVIDERVVISQFYTIHETTQEAFQENEWSLAPPRVTLMLRKYAELAELGTECELRQGMNTGADDVFIIPRRAVPEDGQSLFVPLLSDREMESYAVPRSVSHHVFYPFADGKIIGESELRKHHLKTWEYLSAHRGELERRHAVAAGMIPWWRPERPREPRHILRPKIVTPHVVISPRFGLDARGRYAISRAPMIFSEIQGAAERDHLCFLLGVLNSSACFWHIAQRSHIYDRGYSRLEISTLRGVRIPVFSSVDGSVTRKIARLVESRIEATGHPALDIENAIDEVIADLYGLNADERRFVGMQEKGNGM
jgi:hypothetical protein